MGLKREFIVLRVSDVDRAKGFCGALGFPLDVEEYRA
jgi:hypothetical protein